MPEKPIIEQTRNELRMMLAEVDRSVWQNSRFPVELRPDAGWFRDKIKYSPIPSGGRIVLHPDMKPDMMQATSQFLRQAGETGARNNAAAYNPHRREIVFGDQLLRTAARQRRRVIAHMAAIDLSGRLSTIQPFGYSGEQVAAVKQILREAFADDYAAEIADRTYIEKTGFRELLCADGYVIGDIMNSPHIPELAKIFPTLMELIGEQVMIRKGDFVAFENDLAQKRVKQLRDETHPTFADLAYTAMGTLGWQRLLMAFKTGNVSDTLAILNAAGPVSGEDLAENLLVSITHDEGRIISKNASQAPSPFSRN